MGRDMADGFETHVLFIFRTLWRNQLGQKGIVVTAGEIMGFKGELLRIIEEKN